MGKSIVLVGKRNEKIVEEATKDIEIDVFFFGIETNLESLLKTLEGYETLVFVATLGSWEGEAVIEIAKRCKPRARFFCLTRSGTVQEIMESRRQADEILTEFPDFSGAIISEEMPFNTKIEALKLILD
ncbi:MAG: hypothetical protein ACK401_04995 [Archaeoglobaceae archaeon]